MSSPIPVWLQGMQSCRSLQHISLCHSPIGDEGCQLICHATKLLTNIQSVDLSSCGITAGGVLAVVEMLKVSCCMWSVQLWFLHQYSLTCNIAICSVVAVTVIPPVLHTIVVTSNRMAAWQERTMGKDGGGGSLGGGEVVSPCDSFGGLLDVRAIGVQHWVIMQ